MELSDVNHARNAVVARIAPTFHGRLSELDRATAFIEGTPASPARCLWISGATGVGKSALVRETVHLLRSPNRLIGAGACDPVMPLLPLAAPLQALDAALNQLLQWSEPALSRVRDDVRTALGERCAVLTRMIPALERLLGPHSACEALPPDRSRARLFSALVALIGCLARPQHPMTLVFEDMHGADVATLDLMQALLLEGKSASLSLIATVNMDAMAAEGSAFARTAGIASGSAHRWIDRLEAATGSLLRMPLHNLAPTDSLALLNELLSASTTDRDGVMAAIHQCTQGNPCHNVELVTALRFSGALRHPDAQAAPALPPRFTGSLKRLFSVRMAALGKARRRMLHLAAHLGETFDTDSLRAVSAADDESFAASLAQLQNLGMIVPAALVNIDGALPIRQLAFCHAGLREAARRPWALSRSQWVHLHIARRLSTFWPHPRTMRDTLVLATHHARGAALLMETAKADRTAPFSDTESTAPRANAATTERQAVAASLRHAVHQACEAAGMDAAASFLEAARKLRPAHAWSTDFHDTFAGEAAWHALLYSLGRFDDADRAYETLQRRAPGPLFLVDATVLRMLSLTNRRRRSEAVALGLDLLTKLGAPLPVANPDSASRHAGIDQAARVEFDRFLHMARTLPLETLATAPAADHHTRALARLLSCFSQIVYFHKPMLATWSVCRLIRLWHTHGFVQDMVQWLAAMLHICNRVLPEQHPDHSLGHRALQLAWTLSASRPSDLVSGRVMHLYSLTACHWTEPLEQALAQARLARAKLAAVGSFDSACFTRLTSQSAVLDTATHLDEATHETLASQREARRLDNPDAPAMFWGFRHFVRTLRGCEFHDVDADPRHTDPDPQPSAANDRPVDRALACTYQAIGAALFNDAQALQAHAAALRPLLSSLAGLYPETLARLALVLSGAARSFGEACEGDSELDEHMRWFAERAAGMPANFAHLHDFVQARSAAAAGRLRDAMALFEQAIQAAHAQRRPWHHAFITEQAAQLHIERGLHSTGIDLLRRARSAYRRWGALAKVAQLTRRWPQLDASGQPGGAQGLQDPAIDIDCIALRDASRAIAGETETDRLIARITDVIARVSGSTEACLLRRDADEGWLLVAAARDGEPAVSLHCDVKEAVGHGFALPLIRYASRTLSTELIEDAHSDPRFAPSLRRTSAGPSDPAGTQPSSVLLMPLSSPTGERHAVLLLRNRLVPRFFTPRHIETLSRVTTALSAAMANAQLMRALKRRAAARSHESVQAASELLLRTRALDASTHGVMITDVSSGEEQVIYVNPHFEKSTGYSSDEFRRMGPRVLHARDDRQPALKVLWQAVADKKSCRVLLRNYRSDGEMFWSETSLAPVIGGSGQITHLVSTHVDVTPRVQAETALRLRTERLRAVFDFSPDGFVVLDAGQRVTSVNPAFEAMTGLLASDLLGLDLAGFEERLDGLRVAQPAESPRDILHLHLRSPVPAVLRRRVRQASDSGQETVMFFRDVTQEVETDRIKSEFLATAAHELRTPMTSVFGFSELLLTRRWSIALRHELLQTIHRQSAMLSGLINELLDLARIETGGWGGLDVQRHALQPVIRRAVDSQLAVHGGREVVMTLPDDPVWLRMDAAKMEVAISNALSNALKYSVGPVTVELLEPPHSWRLGLRVTDRGRGMTPLELSRMFERFYRARPDDETSGTGLGATLMKSIVELHGGQISATSEPGQGTVVTLWMDRGEDLQERTQESTQEATQERAPQRMTERGSDRPTASSGRSPPA